MATYNRGTVYTSSLMQNTLASIGSASSSQITQAGLAPIVTLVSGVIHIPAADFYVVVGPTLGNPEGINGSFFFTSTVVGTRYGATSSFTFSGAFVGPGVTCNGKQVIFNDYEIPPNQRLYVHNSVGFSQNSGWNLSVKTITQA